VTLNVWERKLEGASKEKVEKVTSPAQSLSESMKRTPEKEKEEGSEPA